MVNLCLLDVGGQQLPLSLTIDHAEWCWLELESDNFWESTYSCWGALMENMVQLHN